MHLLIVAATPFEIAPLITFLNETFESEKNFSWKKAEVELDVLITGVGMPLTAYYLAKKLSQKEYHLLINAGIAGSFDQEFPLGKVVQVESERFADLGVEEADGSFTDVHDLQLIDSNIPPFKNGVLVNPTTEAFNFLPKVHAISVNKVHGSIHSIEKIRAKYPAVQTESMEGAAFFYVSLMEQKNFLQIRSISNYVEARNRDNWNIPLAIENLNNVLKEMISSFLPSSS